MLLETARGFLLETFSLMLKRCFEPVVDANTRVLVLGSLPGEISLERNQYYAHPQNRFWHLISDVIGENLVDVAYADRLRALIAHHVGLWDVVAEAYRVGSLDSRIRDHESNDLVSLVETLPKLVAVAFNGGTAARIGTRALGELGERYQLVRLPSSSPAYAAMPYSDKQLAWQTLRALLAS